MDHLVCDYDQIVYKIMYRYQLCRDIEWLHSIHRDRRRPYHISETMEPLEKVDLDTLDGLTELNSGVIHCINGPVLAKKYYKDYFNSVFSWFGELVIVQCVIPKGTPFWTNFDFSQIACTKLILWKIIPYDELLPDAEDEDVNQDLKQNDENESV